MEGMEHDVQRLCVRVVDANPARVAKRGVCHQPDPTGPAHLGVLPAA